MAYSVLIESVQSKRRHTLFDESDGLIHRGSIINSNLFHAYQTEYMFLIPGGRHFGMFASYSNANRDSVLFILYDFKENRLDGWSQNTSNLTSKRRIMQFTNAVMGSVSLH